MAIFLALCRLFMYFLGMGRLLYWHSHQSFRAFAVNELVCFSTPFRCKMAIPKYLFQGTEMMSFFLMVDLLCMLGSEPMIHCIDSEQLLQCLGSMKMVQLVVSNTDDRPMFNLRNFWRLQIQQGFVLQVKRLYSVVHNGEVKTYLSLTTLWKHTDSHFDQYFSYLQDVQSTQHNIYVPFGSLGYWIETTKCSDIVGAAYFHHWRSFWTAEMWSRPLDSLAWLEDPQGVDVYPDLSGDRNQLLCWLTRRLSIIWEILKWLPPNSPQMVIEKDGAFQHGLPKVRPK